jgi:hypothetical protein
MPEPTPAPTPAPATKRPVFWGDWEIPKRIVLPGVRARVRLVPEAEIERRGSGCGLWVYSYDEQYATIFINQDMPVEVQRYTLLHELQHLLIELLDVMVEKLPEHVQSVSMAKMTAFLKGDPLEGPS